jgi:hypothetical protein
VLPLVLLSCVLLIEDAVALLPESRAANAIMTALQVVAVEEVATIVAVAAVEGGMELATVHALVAALTFAYEQRIDAIFGIVGRAIVTILRVHGPEDQVAVLHMAHVIAVFAVFGIPDREGELRHALLQHVELLEEWPREVEGVPEGSPIPLVAVPFLVSIYGIFGIDREIRDDLLAGEIALAVVERALVAEGEPPLPATVRTERGWRHRFLLSIDQWRDLVVEREVVFGDLERR